MENRYIFLLIIKARKSTIFDIMTNGPVGI